MRTLGKQWVVTKWGGQASKKNAYYQGNEVLCFGGNFEGKAKANLQWDNANF